MNRVHRKQYGSKQENVILFKFSFKRHFGDAERHTVPIRYYREGDRIVYTAKLSKSIPSGYEYVDPEGRKHKSPIFHRTPKGWQMSSVSKDVSYIERAYSLADLKKKIWMHYRTLSGD